MTQINKLKIGLVLNAIAMLSDEFTYDRIKDRLKEIEQIVAEEPDTDDPEGEPQKPKYCDRNICVSNEYNGIGCDECEDLGDYPDTIPNQFDNMTGSMNL